MEKDSARLLSFDQDSFWPDQKRGLSGQLPTKTVDFGPPGVDSPAHCRVATAGWD